MKNILKRIFFTSLTIIIGVISNAQTLTYEQVKNCTNPKKELEKKYEAYTASDKHTYHVGDDIVIGSPSSNKTFAFFTSELGMANAILGGGVVPIGVQYSGCKMKIKSIKVGGSKKIGTHVSVRAYLQGLGGVIIQFENALQSGEIDGFGISSDKALEELKKEKDKLDLGLITEEEFNKRKEELTKYIK